MRIKIIKKAVFTIDELSDDARRTALQEVLEGCSGFDWWESIYEDAQNVDVKIEEFDTGRASFCKGKFLKSLKAVAEKILANHGKDCETYKLADKYLVDREELTSKYSDGVDVGYVLIENENAYDADLDELNAEFRRAIFEEYLSLLRKDYEYHTSEEYLLEIVKANDYEFDSNGHIA